MNTMTSRNVVNARQDSFDPTRRMIGFRCTTVKPRTLVKSVGVAAIALMSMVGMPSPTRAQHEEKAQEHQTTTAEWSMERDHIQTVSLGWSICVQQIQGNC